MILFVIGSMNYYYLGFFRNDEARTPSNISIPLITAETHQVQYSIEAPAIGYYHNGTVSAGNPAVVNITSNVELLSYDDQDKGIYLVTESNKVHVIGLNLKRYSSDSFFALPIIELDNAYKYYGISVSGKSYLNSSILIVGTENNTMMTLTVTQSVNIKVDSAVINLDPGQQYSFVINRLQTVYIESTDDLSGTKIITNRPVSVFSGHECANIPVNADGCSHLIEQIPPTALWGRVHYTAPLLGKRSYTIKIMAAYNSTIVNTYCNITRTLYAINEAESINITLSMEEYCAIYSNNKVLVVLFSHGGSEDNGYGDPMMTIVPATDQYSSKFDFATTLNPVTPDYDHYINIIVMAEYYQPNMIYLIAGGITRSLATQQWIPITVNGTVEAYATQMTVSEGVINIFHNNSASQLMVMVYGFSAADGYGHIGGIQLYAG